MITVSLDYTLVLQIIQFLIIVFIANKLILKPIKSTIDARNEKIDGLLSSADNGLDAIEASKAIYDKKLEEVKHEIAEYRNVVRNEALIKVEHLMTDAKAEITNSTTKAKVELEKSVQSAKQELNKEIKEISDMIYNGISGKFA